MIGRIVPYRRNTPVIGVAKCMKDAFGGEDYLRSLEEWFRRRCGVKYAVATASGRQAMQLALRASGLGPGDEVVFPTLTFYILPKLARQMGLTPRFVNCGDDFLMDINELEKKITSKTRAIVATHIFGRACHIERTKQIADEHGITVIEDCAHSLGLDYRGKPLGTFGRAGFFSFQNRKPVNAFGGGMLITNDESIYEQARAAVSASRPSVSAVCFRFLLNYIELFLTSRCFCPVTASLLRNQDYRKKILSIYQKIHHKNVDERKPFSNFQARLALEQLRQLDKVNGERMRTAGIYHAALGDLSGVTVPDASAHIFYSYVLLAKSRELAKKIHSGIFPLGVDVGNGEDILRNCGKMHDPSGDYTRTEDLLARMIEMPMYRQLSEEDAVRAGAYVQRIAG